MNLERRQARAGARTRKESLDGVVGSLLLLDSQLPRRRRAVRKWRAPKPTMHADERGRGPGRSGEAHRKHGVPRMFLQCARSEQLLRRHPVRSAAPRRRTGRRCSSACTSNTAERSGLAVEVLEESEGEVAGIKRRTIIGLRATTLRAPRHRDGIHRMVRNRRSTRATGAIHRFASVFAYPEVDDTIGRDQPRGTCASTLRGLRRRRPATSTRTDSAVAHHHLPTNIVVQCQNDRRSTATAPKPWPC